MLKAQSRWFLALPGAPRRRRLQVVAGALLMWLPATAQGPGSSHEAPGPGILTVEQIASRLDQMNARRAGALRGYVSRREMSLHYKGLLASRQAQEVVEMTYAAPSSKQFAVLSSSGSVLLRDSVFQREMDGERAAAEPGARQEAALTPANYNLKLVGQERLPEGECYVLAVSPKTSSRFTYEGKVWVQSQDFAVVRIEARPAKNPSFWVRDGEFTVQYRKIDEFWLPRETVSSSHMRLGGDATFTIQFGAYRLLNVAPLSPETTH